MNKPENVSIEFPFEECNSCDGCKAVLTVDSKNIYHLLCSEERICLMWKIKFVQEVKK